MEVPRVEGVQHRDVTVRGFRMHVAEAGEGDAVVLLHGFPQHWWSWKHLIPALAGRYRVVCPDFRGLGWSEAPADGDYRKDTLADDVLALLRELGIGRARLVGHDWGAFVGFLLAMRPDPPFERMVLLSAAPPWPPADGIDPKGLMLLSYQLPIAAPGVSSLKAKYFEGMFKAGRADGTWPPEELETYLAPLRRSMGSRAGTQLYRQFLTREAVAIARGKYADRRIGVPTRFIIGERDHFHDTAVAQLRSKAPEVEVETVPGAGHFLLEERPDLVRGRVLDFFGTAG